ncbi:MAG: bifunctional MaoC family dehydratase N-terminal/OB-fold nucleic acid binding domain-containing protein [Marmoricola sp.]
MTDVLVDDATHAQVMAGAEELIARGVCSKRDARDPVNQPAINSWLDAMGDTNPRWKNGEAPPAMAQVWTMYALGEERDPDDPLHSMMEVMTDLGFTGVLGTNCEQTYERTMRVGELPRREIRLESVVGPKQTGMGVGYFVTSRTEWFVGDELVASMLFRVLKYIPKERTKPDKFVLYPTRNRDNEYFWEGTAAGELRIQKCNACGALRHPPGPSCPECHAFDRGYVVASGAGTVFSHITHHHPKIPGHTLPLQIALVDLDEGVRLIAGAADPLEIGDRVQIDFRRIDDDLTLPIWRKA